MSGKEGDVPIMSAYYAGIVISHSPDFFHNRYNTAHKTRKEPFQLCGVSLRYSWYCGPFQNGNPSVNYYSYTGCVRANYMTMYSSGTNHAHTKFNILIMVNLLQA